MPRCTVNNRVVPPPLKVTCWPLPSSVTLKPVVIGIWAVRVIVPLQAKLTRPLLLIAV